MYYVFLADGFEETEAIAPLDIIRRAEIEVYTVGVGAKVVTSAHNVPVVADVIDCEICPDKDCEGIILPGGMPGSTNLDNSGVVDYMVKRAVLEDKYICAICAAPFILGKRGILKGKRATCYPGFENQLEGAKLVNEGCVRDGKIITGRAMGSSHDFALEIIEVLRGKDERKRLSDAVLYFK